MKAIVLCGGLGTRMGSLTASLPKPMLPVAGEPLLAHTLRYLASHGVDWVGINLCFLPDVIPAHFGDGASMGLRIDYFREPQLLGTAGTVRAIARALPRAPELLVLYGDLLIDEDLGALVRVHRERGADATLLVHRREGSNSLVALDDEGRIRGFIERPTEEERRAHPYPYVHSGLTVVGPRLIDAIPESTPVDLPRDVYAPNVDRLRLHGKPLSGFRCAIDSPDRLRLADEAVRKGTYDPHRRRLASV